MPDALHALLGCIGELGHDATSQLIVVCIVDVSVDDGVEFVDFWEDWNPG